MKAKKKPVEIEYYPCEGKYKDNIFEWSTKERPIVVTMEEFVGEGLELQITTLEGVHKATNKDIIIKGVNGEVYPCKKDIFEKTYNIIN